MSSPNHAISQIPTSSFLIHQYATCRTNRLVTLQGSAKLEKAEILQMTVDHLKVLHSKGKQLLFHT